MAAYRCEWDLDDDVLGNIWHIAEHGLTKEDVEHALEYGCEPQPSQSSDRKIVFGPSPDDTMIAVLYEEIDPHEPGRIYVVTAYQPGEE